MQLFYSPEINENSINFTFDKTESRHIVRVLRKSEGDKIFITNGKGFLFQAEISVASDKKCVVAIVDKTLHKKPWNYQLHVAVAPTKLNDRMEWFLEKATEIGIDEITPIICDHSERKVVKLERFEKIILSGMKQSLKYHLPRINPAISFNEFINSNPSGDLFIAHCEEQDKKSFKTEIRKSTDITILIGPEGDFSKKEIDKALANNFTPVTLGNSRLRTETAALVACHSVAFVNE
ncbi:16S rRNA (uracil(1498)-N(3))-methyltransferase [Flavicella marina]|uniref:16S rRNA (uracil(1498)-N(3))-methyltransferase n=1 Tax=Flavicella marina TaxID=1475951 RepID=UPI001265044D|nr:16S rRNA (uracil(1498)-N(3))-methyltransferase [Flavicella marina]